jgi:hypothetical protein
MQVNDGSDEFPDSAIGIEAPFAPETPNYAVEAEIQLVPREDSEADAGFGVFARSGYWAGFYRLERFS